MMTQVMEDIEAYGLLYERPLPLEPPSHDEHVAPPLKKRRHWLRNSIVLVAAYLIAAVITAKEITRR